MRPHSLAPRFTSLRSCDSCCEPTWSTNQRSGGWPATTKVVSRLNPLQVDFTRPLDVDGREHKSLRALTGLVYSPTI